MQNLSRRSFLKILGISTAVVAASPEIFLKEFVASNKYSHFNPKCQYRGHLTITDFVENKDDPIIIEALSIMDDQIKETIPPNYRHKIKYTFINPKIPRDTDYLCRYGYASWKYSPSYKNNIKEFDFTI